MWIEKASYEVTGPVEFFDILLPSGEPLPRRYRMLFEGLISDRSLTQPDSLITFYYGFGNPLVWWENVSVYNNTGISNFAGETNPAYAPPLALRAPQTLKIGNRVGIDTGHTKVWGGASGEIIVNCPGVVSGNAIAPTYRAVGHQCHGEFPASTINAATGAPYFPSDPATQNTFWTTPCYYGGGIYGANGLIPRGFRFRNNGATLDGFKFISGRVELHVEGVGQEIGAPPPPPQGVTFSSIGDFNAMATTLDYVINKPAGAGAWKTGTTGWIGKTGSVPWSASTFRIYGSNNDGFVFGQPPTPQATITANFYESDGVPSGPTDGVLVETKVVTDSTAVPVISFSVPPGDRLSRWLVLSHNGSAQSTYVSAVI